MQSDPASRPDQNVDHDADSDSLFGSPPPSPRGRGRSPSPLALPGAAGSAQNVGTLALPGSHLVAEASVHPSASSPLSVNDRATNVAPPPRAQRAWQAGAHPVCTRPAAGHVAHGGAVADASRASSGQRKSKKGKEKAVGGFTSRSSTPRPAAPPIPIPSPDEPVPPNFLRNQQALLGVAGLVGGVNPSQLAPQPGTTAGNPIVLDEDDDDQPRTIGRRPLADSTVPPLPTARGPEILQTLARQGNVLPLVESLVRLLAGTATTAAPLPKRLERTGWERHRPTEAPPLKRRKLNTVPAGASDWDVPYPFQDGQGPADYHTTWAKERARRLVRELVGLVRDAAKKAAVKGYLQEQERARKRKWMDERGWQGRVGGDQHGGRTQLYCMEDGLFQARARSVAPGVGPPAFGVGLSAPTQSAMMASRQTMSEPPLRQVSPAPSLSASSASINQWLASMLASTPPTVEEQGQVEPGAPQAPQDVASLAGSSAQEHAEGTNNNQYFDDWLALLESIPPGDPNDPSALPDLRNVLDDFAAGVPADGSANAYGASGSGQGMDTFPDFFLDPALFDAPVFPDTPPAQPHPPSAPPNSFPDFAQSALPARNHPTADPKYLSPIVPGPSATPSLTGSPLASTASLADAEQSPATPEWAWSFGELGGGGGAAAGLGGVELGLTGADGEGIVVGAEEMREFEKVLEACGPGAVSVPAGAGIRDVDESGRGRDAMDVDGVGTGRGLPGVAEEQMQDGQVTGTGQTASGQMPNGGQTSQAEVDESDQPSIQWLSTAEQAQLQLPDGPSLRNISPAFLPAHSTQPIAGPSSASPGAGAQPSAGSCTPQLATLATAALAPHTAPSPLNALSSLLALTSASKPAGTGTSRLTRAGVLQRAKAMRRDLERAREKARVELWETTVEGACLVGLGREVAKMGTGEGIRNGVGRQMGLGTDS
ncbi:uncharacterized protein C8Q71DRAFT_532945 [Rhodofomes roseus]|uniref:Uncharacterized protein n=1 Tax=Rhodofomes roseus TaxID=34475 RepID=A0ABQ8KK22_9APHY|nr:uncharacterized protein C8Q71DRAFT_532945 [Rhodofomes roseus]KAH9838494.1 hypothetical protein C8Q71DRAFT_532945 [Rhodofomes roseus]